MKFYADFADMTEREQAIRIANLLLNFDSSYRENEFVYVHGDPNCDACILARQFLRASEVAVTVTKEEIHATEGQAKFFEDVDALEDALPAAELAYRIRILKEVLRRLECDFSDN
jgi:hypothetical protein